MITEQRDFRLVIELKGNTYTSDRFDSIKEAEEAMQDLKASFGILDQDMMITYIIGRSYK